MADPQNNPLDTQIRNVPARNVRLFAYDEVNKRDFAISVDPVTGGIVIADTDVAGIGQGKTYELSVISEEVSAESDIDFLIQVQSFNVITATLRFGSDACAEMKIYESPTVSANGTEIFARNRNRTSGDTNGSNFFSGPTVTSPGLLIHSERIYGADGMGAVGDVVLEENEWIFSAGMLYLVRLTNLSTNLRDLMLLVNFTEQ